MLAWMLACAPQPGEVEPSGSEDTVRYVRVAVPRHEIAAGAVITADDLEEVELEDYLPETAVRDPARIVGRTATARLLWSEPVREERLGPAPTEPPPEPRDAEPVRRPLADADAAFVMASARALPAGRPIAQDDLYAVRLDRRDLSEGVFLSLEHVVGRTPCEDVLAVEVVRAERLVDPATGRCAGPGG
jgi:flagella basal body P-ring formation protein FlgA